jgi:hypothetical protein
VLGEAVVDQRWVEGLGISYLDKVGLLSAYRLPNWVGEKSGVFFLSLILTYLSAGIQQIIALSHVL